MSKTKEDLLDDVDNIASQVKELRYYVSSLSDHTFELDALRERVKELEADKVDMRAMIAAYACACVHYEDSRRQSSNITRERCLAMALKEYKTGIDLTDAYRLEHGGVL